MNSFRCCRLRRRYLISIRPADLDFPSSSRAVSLSSQKKKSKRRSHKFIWLFIRNDIIFYAFNSTFDWNKRSFWSWKIASASFTRHENKRDSRFVFVDERFDNSSLSRFNRLVESKSSSIFTRYFKGKNVHRVSALASRSRNPLINPRVSTFN